jgi:hypothetical protein
MEESENLSSPPYFNLIIATITMLIIVFVRTAIFDIAMSEKFDEELKTDNNNFVVLSFKNKITIKIFSLIATIIIMFIIKKTLLAGFLAKNEE